MTTADHAGLPLSASIPTLAVSEIIVENEFAALGLQAAIVKALDETRWNRTAAAKKLGMTFRSLRYRLKKLGLDDDSSEDENDSYKI